jgi:hypothetical protein
MFEKTMFKSTCALYDASFDLHEKNPAWREFVLVSKRESIGPRALTNQPYSCDNMR